MRFILSHQNASAQNDGEDGNKIMCKSIFYSYYKYRPDVYGDKFPSGHKHRPDAFADKHRPDAFADKHRPDAFADKHRPDAFADKHRSG